MKGKKIKVHFMGIGGSGISSVARLARAAGDEVSGCDLEEGPLTIRLRREGVPVEIGHNASHLKGIDLLVHTPAVFYQSAGHPEYTGAREKKIALTWEEFMARYLQKGKFVICVAGTHGKGTTTAMLSRILEKAGLDPTCEVGANLLDWGRCNDRSGRGKYFVCEGDEFRDKFLLYRPNLAVITSIEMDHPEYFRDFEQLISSFTKFVQSLRKPKILVINGENEGCRELIRRIRKIGEIGGVRVVKYHGLKKSRGKLKLPGEHIRSDAAAAAASAKALGVKEKVVKQALEEFGGLERRFEFRGAFRDVRGVGEVRIYDDYAHHPTAVAANIKAARELYPRMRIWAVFQPHMHARLEALFAGFVKSLKMADRVIVTDVFTRREQEVTKPSGKDLALAIGAPKATYVGGDLENVAKFVARNVPAGAMVLVMGAGDVYKVSDYLLKTD